MTPSLNSPQHACSHTPQAQLQLTTPPETAMPTPSVPHLQPVPAPAEQDVRTSATGAA